MSGTYLQIENDKDRYSSVVVSFPCEPEQDEKQVSIVEELSGFRNFVDFYSIQASDIWEDKQHLKVQAFIDLVSQKMGYHFNPRETQCLKKMGAHLERLDFWELGIWQRRNDKRQTTLSKSVSNKNFPQKKRTTQLREQVPSLLSEGLSKSKCRRQPHDQITKNFLKNGYTSQLSVDGKLEALRTDMQMNALQKKWQFVVMAGQMNRWIEEEYDNSKNDKWTTGSGIPKEKENKILAPRPQFKVLDHESCDFRILMKKGEKEQFVPEVVFVKRYRAMKKKQATKKEQKKDINRAIFQLLEPRASQKGGQPSKCSQRDRQLNETLLHIMRVRNTLEHQYRILAEGAINT